MNSIRIQILCTGILLALGAAPAEAKPLVTLHAFQGSDGAGPKGGVIRDADGNVYGTSVGGGAYQQGQVYKIAPDGTLTTLYSFKSSDDGQGPGSRLARDKAGNLYGTTQMGGNGAGCTYFGCGTVFKIAPDGTETVLHRFAGGLVDGAFPSGGVTLDRHGNLYGFTYAGGAAGCAASKSCCVNILFSGCGIAYRIAPDGRETILHEFGRAGDVVTPLGEPLLGAGGSLYGVGAASTNSVIFALSTHGRETILHRFTAQENVYPSSGLIADEAGNLYGSAGGGAHGAGVLYKVAPDGTLAVLYTFKGGRDGQAPVAALLREADGTLFGTTQFGGGAGCRIENEGCGTVFKLTPDGRKRTLFRFEQSEGAFPNPRLVMDADGFLYGTTVEGGPYGNPGNGIVFKIAK